MDNINSSTTRNLNMHNQSQINSSTENYSVIDSNDEKLFSMLEHTIVKLNNNENEINKIKTQIQELNKFYNTMNGLAKATTRATYILFLFPILQGFLCCAIIYYCGLDSRLDTLLKVATGLVGLSTIGEIIFIPIKLSMIENKIKEIEEKFNK